MPIKHASLFRCINENIDHLIEETICLDFQENKVFELKQFRQRELRIIETTEELLQCLQTKKSFWCDHGTRYLAPIMRADTIAGMILLESDQKLSEKGKTTKLSGHCSFFFSKTENQPNFQGRDPL